MILYNFTDKQIHEELLKDMLNVMRFSDYKDKIFRRKVITYEMTKGEQVEKFAHNEKIRKEFENGE